MINVGEPPTLLLFAFVVSAVYKFSPSVVIQESIFALLIPNFVNKLFPN